MRRTIRTRAIAGAALALAYGVPASAQGVTADDMENVRAQEEYLDKAEAQFADMEAARLRGDCEGFLDANDAAAIHIAVERPIGVVSSEQADALSLRRAELSARPCPANSLDEAVEAGSATYVKGGGFGLFGGYARFDLPGTGIAFTRDGLPGEAPDLFAGEAEEEVDGWWGEGFYYIPGTETLLRVGRPMRLGFGYAEGDEDIRFNQPSGAFPATGWPYGAPAPSTSTGLGTPGFALMGDISVNHSAWNIELGLPILGSPRPKSVPPRLDLVAGFSRWDRDYRGFVGFTETFGGFTYEASQERNQQLRENHYDMGLDGGISFPLGGRLIGHVASYAGVYYADRNLSSFEHNLSNFGPVSDRDFTLEIHDSDNGWGYRGGAGATIEFVLSPRMSIAVRASADYWSDLAAVWNPNSGDQVLAGQTTGLRTEDAWSGKVGAGFVARYGGGF